MESSTEKSQMCNRKSINSELIKNHSMTTKSYNDPPPQNIIKLAQNIVHRFWEYDPSWNLFLETDLTLTRFT